mgnify:CR=1 FL=1
MTGNILIKPSVQQKFDSVMQSGRILFFSAPCGFGKTALANALLCGHRTLRLCADAPDFTLRTLPENWDVLLIDDFQLLQEQETAPGAPVCVPLPRGAAVVLDGLPVHGSYDHAGAGRPSF